MPHGPFFLLFWSKTELFSLHWTHNSQVLFRVSLFRCLTGSWPPPSFTSHFSLPKANICWFISWIHLYMHLGSLQKNGKLLLYTILMQWFHNQKLRTEPNSNILSLCKYSNQWCLSLRFCALLTLFIWIICNNMWFAFFCDVLGISLCILIPAGQRILWEGGVSLS